MVCFQWQKDRRAYVCQRRQLQRKAGVFENHISDHYRLREISDAVCLEHGKSILKDAEFYGGSKKEYRLKQNGGLSHREILKADIDAALAQSANKIKPLRAELSLAKAVLEKISKLEEVIEAERQAETTVITKNKERRYAR